MKAGKAGFFLAYRIRWALLFSAILLLSGLIACDESPDSSVGELIERAQAHRQNGELQASVTELKFALQKDPRSAAARLLLGRTYIELMDFAGAEKELLRARELGMEPAELVRPLAQVWLTQGKYYRVLEELRVEASASPAHRVAALVARGNALRGLGRPAEAERSFRTALNHDPDCVAAYLGIARVAMAESDYAKAERALAGALRTAPEDFDALALNGALDFRSGDYATAESTYLELLSSRPDNVAIRLAVAQAQIAGGRIDQAVVHLEAILKDIPRHPDANYLRALAAIQVQDYETATRYGRKVLEENRKHVPSLLIVGTASYALGDFEEAQRYLDAVVAHAPEHAVARRLQSAARSRLGRTQGTVPLGAATQARRADQNDLLDDGEIAVLRSGDLEAARAYFEAFTVRDPATGLNDPDPAGTDSEGARARLEQTIDSNPRLIAPRVLLGRLLLRAGRPADALAATETFLGSHPDHPGLRGVVGLAQLASDRPLEAATTLRSLVDAQPDSPEAHYLLAMAYRDLRDLALFKEQLAKVLSLDPNHLRAGIGVASGMVQQGEIAAASALLGQLRKRVPNNPEVAELDGAIALLRSRNTEAFVLFKRAFEQRPTSALALKLALARQRDGDRVGSWATLEAWLEQHPEDLDVRLALANQYLTSNRLPAARHNLATIVSLAPKNVVALNNLAWVHLQSGDPEAALPLAERALEIAPGDPRIMDTLALALLESGQTDRAVHLLRKATFGELANFGTQIHLARALVQQGKSGEARDILRKILSESIASLDRSEAESILNDLRD